MLTKGEWHDIIYKLSHRQPPLKRRQSSEICCLQQISRYTWKERKEKGTKRTGFAAGPEKKFQKGVDKRKTAWYNNKVAWRWQTNNRQERHKFAKRICRSSTQSAERRRTLKIEQHWKLRKQRLKLIYLRRSTFTDASDFVLKRTASNLFIRLWLAEAKCRGKR